MSDEPLKLRRALPADANAIRDLTRAAYAKWVPLIGREPKPMTADYEHAVAANWIELCVKGEDVLAVLEMIPQARHLLIENLAVQPGRQGQGIGAWLLRHAEAIAREKGFSEVQLYTNAAFAANVTFYARHGYSEFRREQFPAGGVAVHMRKELQVPKEEPAFRE